jgi:hypothetical protein
MLHIQLIAACGGGIARQYTVADKEAVNTILSYGRKTEFFFLFHPRKSVARFL